MISDMDNLVFYLSIALLGYYYLSRLFGYAARRYNWGWWFRNIYLRSWHWQVVRWKKRTQAIFWHGVVKCEKCGSRKRIQVHHINYRSLGKEKMSDLQLICNLCHRKGSGRI
jgi:5-methylcytosine-specific restriction endonuclease McrA